MNGRKIIQIAATDDGITALCDDGSVWQYWRSSQYWTRVDTTPVVQAS